MSGRGLTVAAEGPVDGAVAMHARHREAIVGEAGDDDAATRIKGDIASTGLACAREPKPKPPASAEARAGVPSFQRRVNGWAGTSCWSRL